MTKSKIITFLFVVISCILLCSCSSLDGQNGKNGQNASVEVAEDGYIYIDGKKTEYCFAKKDCSVKVDIENADFGNVYGESAYAYGTAVILTAEPTENGIFVAWKNAAGEIVGKEKDLLIVADNGENKYTAQFACNPNCVTANVFVKFDETTLSGATYTGLSQVPLTDGATLKFDGYGEKALILYKVERQVFEKDYVEINSLISSGDLSGEKIIAYEEFIALADSQKIYTNQTADFYFYVVGKENTKHAVSISSASNSGRVTTASGGAVASSQEYNAGTVLKLKATPERREVNGKIFEISTFSHWEIDGKRVSNSVELVFEVWDNANIVAKFIPKTKFSVTIQSGEAGLTQAKYPDFKTPSKAFGSINGNAFEVALNYTEGVAVVDLGYYTAGETISLQLKLHSEFNYDIAICAAENVWKYIKLSYQYSGVKIGEGNSMIFFVPTSESNESKIDVTYVRTANYYSNATNESGENAKETLSSSGYGHID